MLSVFYFGNIAQHLYADIKQKTEEANELRIYNENCYKTASYFNFETREEYIGKSISQQGNANLLSAKLYPLNKQVLQEYFYTDDSEPPVNRYNFTLFSRPPPDFVS